MSVWTLSMLAYVIDGVVDREVRPSRRLTCFQGHALCNATSGRHRMQRVSPLLTQLPAARRLLFARPLLHARSLCAASSSSSADTGQSLTATLERLSLSPEAVPSDVPAATIAAACASLKRLGCPISPPPCGKIRSCSTGPTCCLWAQAASTCSRSTSTGLGRWWASAPRRLRAM